MKNGTDNTDDTVEQPPSKRIKLEEDVVEEDRLLSPRRHGKGGRRSKSTIEERALVLLNDDRISAVEPQQVLCRMCGHWVKLFKHTDFSPANWRTHADKCESRSGWKDRLRADPGAAFTLTIPSANPVQTLPTPESISAPAAPIASTSAVSLADPATTVQQDDDDMSEDDPNEPLEVDAMLLPPKRVTKTTEHRRLELENDPRCDNAGPHSVLCNMCGQTVRLHNTREYDLWNWLRHAEKCEVKKGWVTSEASGVPESKTVFNIPGGSTSSLGEPPRSFGLESSGSLNSGVPSGQESRTLRRRSISRTLRLDAHRSSKQTASAVSEPDGPVKSRTFGNTRGAETRTEQAEVLVDGYKEVPPAVEDSVSFKRNGKSPFRPVPVIKPEPNGSDDFLFCSPPELKVEDDGVPSIGMKRRKGRSAEERKQALLRDPRAGQVLPNEVFCNMCKKWIKLYKEVDYVESNWVRHAERCSLRLAAKVAPKPTVPAPLPSTSASSTSPGKRSPMKSDDERLRDLQADPRIETIEPQQVLCRICKQWIKLQLYRNYDIWNWRKHIPLCEQRHTGAAEGSTRVTRLKAQTSELKRSLRHIKAEDIEDERPVVPSITAPPLLSSAKGKDETSAEERRAILERDGRCHFIEPQRVTCRLCQRVVGLHVKKDYSLSNWYKHIESCDKSVGQPVATSSKIPSTSTDVAQTTAAPVEDLTATQVVPVTGSGSVVQETPTNRVEEVQLVVSAPPHINKPPKSTPAERRAKLLTDNRVEAVEPNRIRCRLCQHWLKLNEFMEYAPYNWYKHIERCEIRSSLRFQGTTEVPIVVKEEEIEVPTVQALDEPSISTDGSRKRTTPEERLARMQADSRIKTIEKHRARCGVCDKWVKLQNKTEYDPHNWLAHIKKCAEKADAPSAESTVVPLAVEKREPSPVVIGGSGAERAGNPTILGRRALLLNDIRTAAVEPHRVLCGICNQWIKLRDGKDYVPYNWFKHRRKCEKRHGLAQSTITPIEDASVSVAVVKKEPDSVDFGLHTNGQRKISDAEREARLRTDPRLGGVEPGRVFCRMCDSWIRLNMATGFLPGNWIRHAQRCKGRANWQGVTPESTVEPPELSSLEVIDLEYDGTSGGHFGYIELGRLIGKFEPTISSTDYGNPIESKPPPAATPALTKQLPSMRNLPTLRARPGNSRLNSPAPTSLSQSESKIHDAKRMHRTEEARKLELESDPRTKIVHPEKILCNMCDRWIQMRRDVSYSPQNWLKHAGICEQRTGWAGKQKTEGEVGSKQVVLSVVENVAEELMPYNARKRLEEKDIDFEPPQLKPVDWGQVVTSDDEDDYEPPNAVNVAPSTVKPFASSIPDQPPMGRLEPPSTNGTPNIASAPKMSVPSPLAPLRANKADLKANASSTSSNMDMKPVATPTPVMTAPFTTVPLPFYRTPYAPHMVQHGFPMTKDGVPPESASPQNGSAQRSLPFVVPAGSMLPHLLPRPVLVPISHTSRHIARTVSPYSLPRTPPVPSVGLTRANGIPPMHSLGPPQATNGFGNSLPGSPAKITEAANGVAVPVPVKPVLNGGISTEPNVDNVGQSIVSPKESGSLVTQHALDGAVSSLSTKSKTDIDKETSELLEVAFQSKPVLQLGPRVDLPMPAEKPREKQKDGLTASDATVQPEKSLPPVKPVPGVLQLPPAPGELPQKEKQEKNPDTVDVEKDVATARERLDVPKDSPSVLAPKQDAMLVDA